MKNLFFFCLLLVTTAFTIKAQECEEPSFHFSGKIYPSLFDGSLRGFNAGVESGYSHFALGLYGQNIFNNREGNGETFYRIEVQPRLYGCIGHDGPFAAFSYMHYSNSESSIGGLMGYKFQAVDFVYVELFGGLQQNTSFEMDWNDVKWRSRFGLGLVFGF